MTWPAPVTSASDVVTLCDTRCWHGIWTIVCFSITASVTDADDIEKIMKVTLELIIQFKNIHRQSKLFYIFSRSDKRVNINAVFTPRPWPKLNTHAKKEGLDIEVLSDIWMWSTVLNRALVNLVNLFIPWIWIFQFVKPHQTTNKPAQTPNILIHTLLHTFKHYICSLLSTFDETWQVEISWIWHLVWHMAATVMDNEACQISSNDATK